MPPAFKTSKVEILNSALQLASEGGLPLITARELGKRLNLSSRPIYSFYPSISDLKKDVISEIIRLYEKALSLPESDDPFFNVGLGQLRFAKEHPIFYKIMEEHYDKDPFMKEIYEKIKALDPYKHMPPKSFMDIYRKMAIFTDGLALWIMNKKLAHFSEKNIRDLLSETAQALISKEMIQEE